MAWGSAARRPDGDDGREAECFGAELARLVLELGGQVALGHLWLDQTPARVERTFGLATGEPRLFDFLSVFDDSQLFDEAVGREKLDFRQRFGERTLEPDRGRMGFDSQLLHFRSHHGIGDDGQHPLARRANLAA